MDDKSITVQSGAPVEISDYQISKVFITNNVTEIITTQRPTSHISRYRRLSKSSCIDTETGEVFECQPKPRKNNPRSLQRSFHALRRLINNNFTGSDSEKQVVLTYADHVTNYNQVNLDYKRFWSRFRLQTSILSIHPGN